MKTAGVEAHPEPPDDRNHAFDLSKVLAMRRAKLQEFGYWRVNLSLSILPWLAATLSIIIGISTLVGWHLNLPTLLLTGGTFAPQSYNSGLAFIFLGLALAAILKQRKLLAVVFALVPMALGLPIVFKWLTIGQTGIEAAISSALPDSIAYTEKMSPNSSIAFILLGWVLVMRATLLHGPFAWRIKWGLIGGIGATAACLGLFSIAGYLLQVASAYDWGAIAAMSLKSALGFSVAGLCLVGWAAAEGMAMGHGLLFCLRAPVVCAVLCGTLLMTHAVRGRILESREAGAKMAAEKFSTAVTEVVSLKVKSLSRLASRMLRMASAATPMGKNEWANEATEYIADLPGLESLTFFDSTLEQPWTAGTSGLIGSYDSVTRFEAEFLRARPSLLTPPCNPSLSRPLALSGHAPVMLAFLPVGCDVSNRGTLMGGFNIAEALGSAIAAIEASGYGIKLVDAGFRFYETPHFDENAEPLLSRASFDVFGRRWALEVRAGPNLAAKSPAGDNLHFLVLASGLLMAWLVGKVMRLASAARLREDSLQAMVEELDRQVEHRKLVEAELRKSEHAADAANQAKSTFLANMSHEIRTPMGAILGFSEMILDPKVERDDRLKFADVIHRCSQRLSKLLDDILDLSKIEAGHLSIEMRQVALREIIFDISELLRQRADAKGLELVVTIAPDVPDIVLTDPTRLSEILTNILGNAIKFTESGEVSLAVQSDYPKGRDPSWRLLRFTIADTGIGLTREQASRLFQPFSQAHATTSRRYGGTGLGLALSRRLAQAMGGDVVLVQSRYGQGSCFEATILAEALRSDDRVALGTANPTASSPSLTLTGKRILIIDDAPENLALFSAFLRNTGANVSTTDQAEQGIALAMSKEYDVILMDVEMPEIDGYEATARLRAQGYRRPILALTAHAMNEVRVRCERVGCDDCLTKPIDRTSLIETVSRYAEVKG